MRDKSPLGGGTICETFEKQGCLNRKDLWYDLVILMRASMDLSAHISKLGLV